MTSTIRRGRLRAAAAVVAASALAVTMAACSSDSGSSESSDSGSESSDSESSDTESSDASGGLDYEIDCSVYEEFGDLSGTEVSLYTSIVEPESDQQMLSYTPFEECTGVTVNYEGSREFEAQLLVRIQAGNAPDIAILPQPGLLNTIVSTYPGEIVEPPAQTEANVDEYWEASWKEYGSVDGTFYAAPLGANVKSFVWYSPSAFADKGYEIPETWDDMIALSQTIADDADTPMPWCAGIGSGDATGWPATDWIEDVVLRSGGPDVYDQWVNHEIPFNDQAIIDAFDQAAEILQNPEFVNAGLGGVDSIAGTEWDISGIGVLEGTCWMHRAANFYSTQWPEGTTVAEDGDVYAFYLPGDGTTKPVLGGGEFIAAFDDRPEVQAFQTYLASAEWANAKALATPTGGWVSANRGLEISNLGTEFDQLNAEILQDSESVFRFDGSDLMPGEVGAGTFWTGMVDWFTGTSTQDVLDSIEASWPDS